jgi:iron(II)-dependent oxidoreductase
LLDLKVVNADSPYLRHSGKGLLSLALMDARNRTLRWISAFEESLARKNFVVPVMAELNPPLWELGHIGWFQEHWVPRNVQRRWGAACDPTRPRLASLEPHADRWWDPASVTHDERWQLDLPDLQSTKRYLADTIEITLELLDTTDETDDALYFFRLALFHEDMHGEAFAHMAQTLGLRSASAKGLLIEQAMVPARKPLMFPARRWTLGMAIDALPGGFVFDNEKWGHDVYVPGFEIDAQPVTWAQYSEFVEDGGYDEPRWWSSDGWAWLQREGRRSPRHVNQMRHGVLQQRFGRLTQVPMGQPAVHVSWYEAEAWCRWAGRRLPSEVEWELAASTGRARGFHWGEVWEWTGTTFGPYPGFTPDPDHSYSRPCFGTHKVLRGASCATSERLRHPKYRQFHWPDRDDIFSGFRSCAL